MKIEIQTAELYQLRSAIKSIRHAIPASLAYKLSKLLKSLDDKIDNHEEEKIKLLSQYNKDNATNEEVAEFNARYLEMLMKDIEVEFEGISIEEFNNVNLTIDIIDQLSGVIIEADPFIGTD